MTSKEAQEKYFERLTEYTISLIRNWKQKGYTGNITINFNDGYVTSLKPSLFYGISTMPVMEGLFK
jgi:hypothetical protein